MTGDECEVEEIVLYADAGEEIYGLMQDGLDLIMEMAERDEEIVVRLVADDLVGRLEDISKEATENIREFAEDEVEHMNKPAAGEEIVQVVKDVLDESSGGETEVEKEESSGGETEGEKEEKIDTPTRLSRTTDHLLLELKEIQESRIVLNVGGTKFYTSGVTLKRDRNSLLADLVDKDCPLKPYHKKTVYTYFLDRPAKYYDIIFEYLRNDCLISPILLGHDIKFLTGLQI